MGVRRRLDLVGGLCLSALVLAGCAKATLTTTRSAGSGLPSPTGCSCMTSR
jgi:hypothetical protein